MPRKRKTDKEADEIRFSILKYLNNHPNAMIVDISTIMNFSGVTGKQSDITHHYLRSLEDRGYVSTSMCEEDHRVTLWSITELGFQLYKMRIQDLDLEARHFITQFKK